MKRLWRQQWIYLKKRLTKLILSSNIYLARADFERDLGAILAPLSYYQQQKIKQAFGNFDNYWSGMNYSERIWKNEAKLKAEIMDKVDKVVNGLLDKEKLIQEVQERFEVGLSFAERLVVTELSAADSKKKLYSFHEKNYKYVINRNYGNPCPICQSKINKKIPIEEAVIGVNVKPFHPWDKCILEGVE